MARQDGREDELVVDGRHGFPFGRLGPAQGSGASLRHSSAAAENVLSPLDERARIRGGSDRQINDHPRLLPDVRPAPQAGCFVSGFYVSSESQITLRHRAFGTVAVSPSSTVHDTFSSPGRKRCSATWRLNTANTEQSRASGRRLSVPYARDLDMRR